MAITLNAEGSAPHPLPRGPCPIIMPRALPSQPSRKDPWIGLAPLAPTILQSSRETLHVSSGAQLEIALSISSAKEVQSSWQSRNNKLRDGLRNLPWNSRRRSMDPSGEIWTAFPTAFKWKCVRRPKTLIQCLTIIRHENARTIYYQ